MVDFNQTRFLMQKALDHLQMEISTIRTGRASPALIENISCQVYQGSQTLRLKELGSITVPDPKSLVVQPWDSSIIGEIKQSILAANVGLTPVIENNVVRISVPALTTERRQEFIKLLHQKGEEAKVAIRNVRRDKMVEIKESFDNKELSEDEKFRTEHQLQEITDEYIGKVEEIEKKKEGELLQV